METFFHHGLCRHDGTIVTASEGGVVSYWKYPEPQTFDPIDEQVRLRVLVIEDCIHDNRCLIWANCGERMH